MKKIIMYSVLMMIVTVFAASCSSNDDNSSTTTPVNTTSINGTVTQGSWRVTLFDDSGNDETGHFTGYAFVFNSNGSVTATKDSSVVSGTWSNGNDDSQTKMVLNFGTTNSFSDLNEDWHVLQLNATTIKLQDVSGGNGGTDNLTFEKI